MNSSRLRSNKIAIMPPKETQAMFHARDNRVVSRVMRKRPGIATCMRKRDISRLSRRESGNGLCKKRSRHLLTYEYKFRHRYLNEITRHISCQTRRGIRQRANHEVSRKRIPCQKVCETLIRSRITFCTLARHTDSLPPTEGSSNKTAAAKAPVY